MFSNCNLLCRLSKFQKCNFDSRLESLFYSCGVMARWDSGYSRNRFFRLRQINGFQKSPQLPYEFQGIKCTVRNLSQVSNKKCWSCHQDLKLEGFNCASCGALQHLQDMNFFRLLGVSQTYDIDLENLKKNFINLQMTFHPDKFAKKSKEEVEISEAYSRLVNKAYTTLRNPVERGYYLLQLQNVSLENPPMDPDFLNNMMDKNEELEDLKEPYSLDKFLKENDKLIKQQINVVNLAFRRNQVDDAKLNLSKLKFYINLENRIKEKQQTSTQNDS